MMLVAICAIIIYVSLTLTFIVGTIIHVLNREWNDLPISILGSCSFIGLILIFFGY